MSEVSQNNEIAQRAAFLDLDAVDRAHLDKLAPLYESCAADFVDTFYRHLLRFEETAKFLGDPRLVERLKRAQNEHFKSMLGADWDEKYVSDRQQVGHTHAEVGIEPHLFLGAYNQYAQFCFRRFATAKTSEARQDLEQLLSVLKVIFLDVGLTLDAYFDQLTQKLRHALDMLWRANIELKHFAQLASHDLKTPLATVANLCDEALDEFGEQMPVEARNLVEAAKKRTFRMSTMIDELLASQLAPEGSETNSEIESEAALAEAIERVRPLAGSKGVEINVPHVLPRVWGNRIRLQEAFYNLLSNAVKFSAGPHARVDVTVDSQEGHYQFCISDTGSGIPPEELERIFMPFRRLPQHRQLPGSGLGLYFTKHMIEHQEGRVWVESQPGQGSRFFVLLKKRQ